MLCIGCCLILVLGLVGCDKITGSANFNLNLAYPKALGYDITRVHVTMTHQISGIVVEDDLTVDASNETATGTISDIRIGLWTILVEIYESDILIGSSSGDDSVLILPNETANATIHINLDTGDVNITVTWETALLFEETFDTYATGSPPVPPWTESYWPASQPGITREEAEALGVTVWVDETVYYGSSGKSLHFLDTSGSASVGSDLRIQFDQATHVVVEYYMRTNDKNREGAFFNLRGGEGHDRVAVFNPDGNIRLFANTGWEGPLLEYSENIWYYVRREINVTTNIGTFYVAEAGNPANNSGYHSIGMKLADTYVNEIILQTSNSQGADCYIDEITVTTVAP